MALPQQLWAALVVLGLIVALFAQRFYELYLTWKSADDYSHGFLVPLVSLFFAAEAYRRQGPPREGNLSAGLVWLLGGFLIHVLALLIWLPWIDYLALVPMLHGFAVLLGGRTWARGFRFPIWFLFFMFPVPLALTKPAGLWLQQVVSTLATALLQLFVPAYQKGYQIFLPGQQLEVGEACNGMRQVVAFAALTLVVVHCTGRSWLFRIALLVSAVPVAIAANLLRVLLMALVSLHFGPRWISSNTTIPYLGLDIHTAWGLLTMLAGLGFLVAVSWWLKHLLPEAEKTDAPALPEPPRAPATDAPPARGDLAQTPARSMTLRLGVAGACLALGLVSQIGLLAYLQGGEPLTLPELRSLKGFPVSLGAWSGTNIPHQDIQPAALPYFLKADDNLNRMYRQQGTGLSCRLWMVHFRNGEDRRHHPINCAQAAGLREDPDERDAVLLEGEAAPIRRFCIRDGRSKSYVFYWHYTFIPPLPPGTSELQRLYQLQHNPIPSLTVEVFTTAQTPAQLEQVAAFARQVERELRANYLPEGVVLQSNMVPVNASYPPPSD
jgi:exosortase